MDNVFDYKFSYDSTTLSILVPMWNTSMVWARLHRCRTSSPSPLLTPAMAPRYPVMVSSTLEAVTTCITVTASPGSGWVLR